MEKMILITLKEYVNLINASRDLDRLQGAGVDNWEGYDYAFEDADDQLTEEDFKDDKRVVIDGEVK